MSPVGAGNHQFHDGGVWRGTGGDQSPEINGKIAGCRGEASYSAPKAWLFRFQKLKQRPFLLCLKFKLDFLSPLIDEEIEDRSG